MMKAPSLVPIIGIAIINGIFSPYLVAVFALQGLWFPFFLPASLSLVFAASSLLLSTLYIMVSGVPAAIYEKLVGQTEGNLVSRLLWLGSIGVLSLPTLPNVLSALGWK